MKIKDYTTEQLIAHIREEVGHIDNFYKPIQTTFDYAQTEEGHVFVYCNFLYRQTGKHILSYSASLHNLENTSQFVNMVTAYASGIQAGLRFQLPAIIGEYRELAEQLKKMLSGENFNQDGPITADEYKWLINKMKLISIKEHS